MLYRLEPRIDFAIQHLSASTKTTYTDRSQIHFVSLQYADRWTIGEEQVIKTVPGHRVRDFYHHWYRPENMAVVVVGDFSNVEVI